MNKSNNLKQLNPEKRKNIVIIINFILTMLMALISIKALSMQVIDQAFIVPFIICAMFFAASTQLIIFIFKREINKKSFKEIREELSNSLMLVFLSIGQIFLFSIFNLLVDHYQINSIFILVILTLFAFILISIMEIFYLYCEKGYLKRVFKTQDRVSLYRQEQRTGKV